jgi:hypothetical protein
MRKISGAIVVLPCGASFTPWRAHQSAIPATFARSGRSSRSIAGIRRSRSAFQPWSPSSASGSGASRGGIPL